MKITPTFSAWVMPPLKKRACVVLFSSCYDCIQLSGCLAVFLLPWPQHPLRQRKGRGNGKIKRTELFLLLTPQSFDISQLTNCFFISQFTNCKHWIRHMVFQYYVMLISDNIFPGYLDAFYLNIILHSCRWG